MKEKKFKNLEEMRGKALQNVLTWENLNLKYKVIADINRDKCIECQLCYIACEDGAHQAIGLKKGSRIPYIIEENCVGCNLCSLICPVEGCISMVRKDDGKEKTTWRERTEKRNIPTTFNDTLAGGIHHWNPEPKTALKKNK